MRAPYLLSLWLLLLAVTAGAQKYTISGFVTDSSNGEKLMGATVYDLRTQAAATANDYGFFSLTLNTDTADLICSYVGYQPFQLQIIGRQSRTLNIKLMLLNELKEVEIKATRNPIERQTQMSSIQIPMAQAKRIAALGGEVDIIKVIQLLPGVQKGTEGASGIYVRGGGPDQNLILLDGVPVYNVNHLFGFFSVFNSDAINNVQLIKGGFPAQYGGRLSSVIDISMKEGNNQKFGVSGGIGLIASRLTVEGPLKKDKGSFIISGRRTYADLLFRPLIRRLSGGEFTLGYYFYDVNAKMNYKITERDRIYVSLYAGQDVFSGNTKTEFTDEEGRSKNNSRFGLNWGNITTALRWNHVISPKIFMNTTATYSRYRFNVFGDIRDEYTDFDNPAENRTAQFGIKYFSGIDDVSLKADFDFAPNNKHHIKWGAAGIYHIFTPGINQIQNRLGGFANIDTLFGAQKINAGEISAYIQDDWEIVRIFKVNAGVHASMFPVADKTYWSVQPRIATRTLIIPSLAFKASFCTMTQYLHLLTNAGAGLPTDLWVPATGIVPPQHAWQAAGGLAYTLMDQWEFSIEGYYKRMRNVIDYKNGVSFVGNAQNWEDQVTVGKGWSYGTEFFVQKKEGKLTGWVGYTLSWTYRQFDDKNLGKPFFYKYDRRHDLSITGSYEFNKNWYISATWIYATGNALTIQTDRYLGIEPNTPAGYLPFVSPVISTDRLSNYRVPDYHRLDLAVNYSYRDIENFEIDANLSIYNVYSRLNPFFVTVGQSESDPDKTVLKKVSIFPILPTLSVNFKWTGSKPVKKPKREAP